MTRMEHFTLYLLISLGIFAEVSSELVPIENQWLNTFSEKQYKHYLKVVAPCTWEALEIMLKKATKPDKVKVGRKTSFVLVLTGLSKVKNQSVCIDLSTEDPKIATTQVNVTFTTKKTSAAVGVHAHNAGETYVIFNTTQSINITNLHTFKVKVYVVHSYTLVVLNMVIGWIYFVAWSVSFYPQVYVNWSRKSVVGLNFDFLCYNILGFIAYGVFNVGMFWIPKIKSEYHAKHPNDDVDPVEVNDVFFTLHAILLTSITIFQCFIYDRGQQRISVVCKVLVSIACLFALITLIVTIISDELSWLQYVYYFSYIKIAVTLIKYIPQVYMNFRRKSTVGWSIGNVLLDFTGGSFSIVQMIILAYNNSSWDSIFGDLTKFGLGFISILFDILFMIQHYVLYGSHKPGYEEIAPIQEDSKKTPSLA